MKHLNLTFLTIIFTIFILSTSNTIQAQMIDDSDELIAAVELDNIEERNTVYNTRTVTKNKKSELAAKAEAYDLYVSKDFGTYLNPYNGKLNIINNNSKVYTKAQFLHIESNKNVFSIELNEESKSIDISDYKPGEYMLMLSNKQGDLLVENFIIL